MAKYNVTVVTVPGLTIHHAFDEVRDSLAWALTSLGHEVSTTENWFSESGETNIVFGAELIVDFQRLPKNTIVYNLEQPSHPNMAKVRRQVKESGCMVWDYSRRSIDEWHASGIENAYHVPVGYTPNLVRIPSDQNTDIDVLFLGWMTPRRESILEEIRKAGLTVQSASSSCYGGARDNLISRSKVCLNVHHDGRDRFEVVRCSYYMANSRCVVTENSSDDDEYSDLDRGLTRVPYRLMVDYCRSLCATPTERRKLEDAAFEVMSQRDYTAAVSAALETMTPPEPAQPIQRAAMRAMGKRDYLAAARNLSVPPIPKSPEVVTPLTRPRDPRVAARYVQASTFGDMKDFALWLREHAKGNIVEIGVRDGASTACFLAGVEEHGGHVYSIDVEPCANLFSGHPQWSFLQCNSFELQKVINFIPFQIDVLLIDGDHSRAGVLNDFEYQRQVRAGGLILFHDIAPEAKPSGCTDMSWPSDDVKRVYEELCALTKPMGWTHEEPPGRYGLGVLRKPPMQPPSDISTYDTLVTTEVGE